MLLPCYSKRRGEPILIVSTASSSVTSEITNTIDMKALWTLCHGFFNVSHTVPDWSGWISQTAEIVADSTKSRIGYMAPLMSPITDYATVQ